MALIDLTQNEYFLFSIILLGSIVFSTVFNFFLKTYMKKLTQKTKTQIDDIILNIITRPVHFLIVFIGLYFAINSLSVASSYAVLIDRIFFIGSVLIASFLSSKILSVLIGSWLQVHKRFKKTPQLISKMVSVIIYIFAVLSILGYFNVEITPLIAGLGIGGLAVGFALQNTLMNFFAGLHIISDRPINVGDHIHLVDPEVSGYVEDVGWRSTRIRTLANTIVIIPNGKLAESVITNDSQPSQDMSALVQCGVAYGSDLKKVEKVTIDAAKKVQKTIPGAVKDFEPFIRFHTFGDSNINFSVILRVENFINKYLVIHEFIKEVKERFDKEGIEISWPVRKIYNAK